MKNLVCNEIFGINCASAEAQFGTGRGIIVNIDLFCTILTVLTICDSFDFFVSFESF